MSDSHLPKKNCDICFFESLLNMMRNTFYRVFNCQKLYQTWEYAFNNTAYSKQIPKQEKNVFKLNIFLIMVEPYYIKGVQKQLLADVLQNRCFLKI